VPQDEEDKKNLTTTTTTTPIKHSGVRSHSKFKASQMDRYDPAEIFRFGPVCQFVFGVKAGDFHDLSGCPVWCF
jgi:hypothetical protein